MVVENLAALVSSFSYDNLWVTIKPLISFILGIAIYAVFIFKFYRFVAKKDLFELDVEKYQPGWGGFMKHIGNAIGYSFKYFIVFPSFLFFWFLVLTILLVFLAKTNDIQTIMLISVSLIGAIRVTAYYDEDLSKDLAKMLPFALLGIFLVDMSYFSQVDSIALVLQLPVVWRTMVIYLIAIVLLEFILRVVTTITRKIFHRNED